MPTLLLVEDNASLARTLARFLHQHGRHTIAAIMPSAEAALEQLPNVVVDLALVDVSLPKMNGIDLVAILHARYPDLPCVMLSGHNEISYVARALAAGAKGYIVKDKPTAMLTGIEQVLAGEIYLSDDLRKKLQS